MTRLAIIVALVVATACADRPAGQGDRASRGAFVPGSGRGARDARTPRAPWEEVTVIRIAPSPAAPVGAALDADLLSDGGVVLIDPSSGELQHFDEAGERVRDLAAQPTGGGTSRAAVWLGVMRGDTIVTYSAITKRFAFHTTAGDAAGGRRLDNAMAGGLLPSLISIEGTVAFARPGFEHAPLTTRAGLLRDSARIVLAALHADTVHGFGPFPVREYVVASTGNNAVATPFPFGAELFATSCNDGVFVAWNADSVVTFAGWDGEVYDSIALPLPAVPLPPAAWRSALAGLRNSRTSNEARAIDLMVPPLRLPRFAGFAADGCDRLWVRPFTIASDSASVWLAYDRAGRVIDRESLAGSADIVRFRGRRVLVRSRAVDGSWELRVYERRR